MVKIEMVVPHAYLVNVLRAIDKVGVKGYTAIDVTRSKGPHRGESYDEGSITANRNSYLFFICKQEQEEAVFHELKPVLDRFGGLIFSTAVQRGYPSF